MEERYGYQKSLQAAERAMETMMHNQCLEEVNPDYGGVYEKEYGLIPQNGTSNIPMTLYFTKESRYYKDSSVLLFSERALTHLERNINADGTIHYFMCNLFSAPDTAFLVLTLAREAKLMRKQKLTEREGAFLDRLLCVLHRMGEGMLAGGFHTPNHRWVLSAALSMLNGLMPDRRYLERVELFLAEGIDCNEDGEYTERSAGGYNEINNRALLILAQETGKMELLTNVKRNLEMMPAYFYPDFSVFTQNSTRQDKGSRVWADLYAYQYLLCGYLLKDRELSAVGRTILENCVDNGRDFPISLEYYHLTPEVFEDLPNPCGTAFMQINRFFADSGAVRMTQGDFAVWMLAGQPTFLYGSYRKIPFVLRGYAMFFNCRNLELKNLRETSEGYAAEYYGAGRYYLPVGSNRPNTVWARIAEEGRACTPELTIRVRILLQRTETGFSLRLQGEGCEKTIIRFEMDTDAGLMIRGDGFTIPTVKNGDLIMKKGDLELSDGCQAMKVGPFFASVETLRRLGGSITPPEDMYHIYFQDRIPFDRTICFKKA